MVLTYLSYQSVVLLIQAYNVTRKFNHFCFVSFLEVDTSANEMFLPQLEVSNE